ncbi:MAG: RNA-binding cell elongation regulator Jag/EloR [Candidatus Faecousia sp.]|nr:Jag N-terminal domain-containing protein [Oscillospiraceae bacterium]MDY2557891.1 RNA-binding cell elongation regulator Jag/EloR [Candidatus Faecousia sp.]
MEKTLVATGKTIDLAIESALAQLGLDRDSVSVQVLQQAKGGFLGLGAQPAKVQVTYEAPDEVPAAPKVALSSASRKPKPAAPKVPEAPKPVPKPEMPKAPEAPKQAAPKPTEAPKAPEAPKQRPPKAPRQPKPEAPKAPAAPKEYAPAPEGSVEEKIERFIKGLLEHMDSNAVPHCWKESGSTYRVDLVGEDLGYLIGRRGDTLDAIQHLCNYAVNRDVEGHIRVNVDAEAYRQKREESLRRYARKKAQQVLKARRRTTLEPMNAYERHVIHAALQDMENITTHSTGVEPNRCVVIEYVR